MKKDYKWRLVWSDYIDSQALRDAVKYCSTVTIFDDAKAHLIDYTEYLALIKQDDIAPAESYWQVRPDRVGLIALSHYDEYTTTWEHVSNCKTDFLAGYKACQTRDRILCRILANAQTAKPNALRKAVDKTLKALFID